MGNFFKQAAEIELKQHQVRAINKFNNNAHGLLVYHGLGSGKTITSIMAADSIGANAAVVVPASLRENYQKEIKKVKPKNSKFDVVSYEKFSKNPESIKGNHEPVDHRHRQTRLLPPAPRRHPRAYT